eukprot:Selendium_serpulae@DN10978_c0_g1_i1.p1
MSCTLHSISFCLIPGCSERRNRQTGLISGLFIATVLSFFFVPSSLLPPILRLALRFGAAQAHPRSEGLHHLPLTFRCSAKLLDCAILAHGQHGEDGVRLPRAPPPLGNG